MLSNFLSFILLTCPVLLSAQSLSISGGLGTGKTYLFEHLDKGIDVNYGLPVGFYYQLGYTPLGSKWSVSVRNQYLNVPINGINWKNNQILDGEVSSFSTFLLLSKTCKSNQHKKGYSFGFGRTSESLKENLILFNQPIHNDYLSIMLTWFISYSLSENLELRIEPQLFWHDPIGSFRSPDRWQLAGEDGSIIINVGLSYMLN